MYLLGDLVLATVLDEDAIDDTLGKGGVKVTVDVLLVVGLANVADGNAGGTHAVLEGRNSVAGSNEVGHF